MPPPLTGSEAATAALGAALNKQRCRVRKGERLLRALANINVAALVEATLLFLLRSVCCLITPVSINRLLLWLDAPSGFAPAAIYITTLAIASVLGFVTEQWVL